MSGYIAHLAALAVAQQAATPAPPPSPPIKGGTFACRVFDRAGKRADLTGALGNWRLVRGNPIADLTIEGPKGLSFKTTVPMRPGRLDIHAYDNATATVTSGGLDIGYAPDGTITLERRVLNGSGTKITYVGFCDTQFTASPRKIPA